MPPQCLGAQRQRSAAGRCHRSTGNSHAHRAALTAHHPDRSEELLRQVSEGDKLSGAAHTNSSKVHQQLVAAWTFGHLRFSPQWFVAFKRKVLRREARGVGGGQAQHLSAGTVLKEKLHRRCLLSPL